MPARNSVELKTYLAIALKTSGMSTEQVTQKARLKEPDLLERVLRGEAQLPLESAVRVAKVLEKDPGFLMQLALVANHPEIWAVLRHQPDCLLGYNERAWMRLYWRVSPNGRKKLKLRHRRKALAALSVEPEAYLEDGDDEDG